MKHSCLLVYACGKRGFLRLGLLFLLIFSVVSAGGCANKEQISYDFSAYLSGNTDFERKVATVMPSKKQLEDSKITYYMYYDNGEDISTFANSMIRLTVEYSDEAMQEAMRKIEELSKEYYDDVMGGEFYYNGTLYKAFQFYDEGYCALAYHICPTSNTIAYIAFACDDLTYMNVGNALSQFPQIICEDQIIQ